MALLVNYFSRAEGIAEVWKEMGAEQIYFGSGDRGFG
jgi:hypothetical protein